MNQIIEYQGYVKILDELPKHITFNQYKKLREEIIPNYYKESLFSFERRTFLIMRDKLLVDFIFATGGRIGDVVNIKKENIDFDNLILTLNIKKNKKIIKINLDRELCYDTLQFINRFNCEEKIFDMTSTNAWYLTKKYGKEMNMELHPHMFRHGLAIYLLSQNVPIPIISYRLGHASTKVTMDMYMKITPDIENNLLSEVIWR